MKNVIASLVIIVVVCSLFPMSSQADEYYEFYRIMYANDLAFFHMSRIGIWNKGYYIWPLGSKNVWKEHVRNLKLLEKKYGLYVLDGAYGYYDKKEIGYLLSASHRTDIKIEYKKSIRPAGPVGSKQPYKSDPRLSIYFEGTKVAAFDLSISGTDNQFFVDEVSVNDMDGVVELRVCAVLDPSNIDRKYKRKCTETTLYDLSSKSIVFDNSRIAAFMRGI